MCGNNLEDIIEKLRFDYPYVFKHNLSKPIVFYLDIINTHTTDHSECRVVEVHTY